MMASNNIAPVILSDYDPSCPEKFQIEKVVLTKLIGERAKSIEHIGSTSVPDMVAKPEIDILVGLTNLSDAESFIEILKDAGYHTISVLKNSSRNEDTFEKVRG